MRFVFFLGGLLGIGCTTLCFAHVPAQARNLTGGDGHERLLAAAFFCLTLMALALTYFCVKEVFEPPASSRRK